MTTFQQRLDALIDDFRAGRISFAEFQQRYSMTYIDENADQHFSPQDVEYYGNIHDKAEWTSKAPTDEERGYGWLDVDGFRSWLARHAATRP